jgi:small subunit ribosomal protein S16
MIKIRLRRTGMKKQPHYRIVVADARAPRDGKYIDLVGHYNPLTEPATIEVDTEKAAKWIRQGAQMTETVEKLFTRAGVLEQVRQKKAE